ncbi:DUF6182 family protein [Streptomyces sp. NPDC091371]|uniref:DUF6182 family protein n=1 Tax=Streptomyces sp. NPDC091371 TaxID=3155303 RepID=UPI00344A5BC0
MTLSPDLLLTVAAERLLVTRPELAGHLDLSTSEALRKAKATLAGGEADGPHNGAAVVMVVGRFSLPHWVQETCRFALSVPADRAGPWHRSFTRTLFLAGRPNNLKERFAFDHIADDGSTAWIGPAPDEATAALRRLLKSFDGTRELPAWAPTTVAIPAPVGESSAGSRPVCRDLYIATAGVTVSDVLIQVNHLLAEAVLDGLIQPGDRLTLRSVPRLAGLAMRFAALRVDTDTRRPHELRAYAGLTEEI